MTADMNLTITTALPLQSNTKYTPSPQDESGVVPQISAAVPAKDSTPHPADTISISSLSRQATTDVKKEGTKKEDANILQKNSEKPDAPTSRVQFVYDLKGELITKYMDSANRLIYQSPSELMLKLQEVAAKSDSSVDMKA